MTYLSKYGLFGCFNSMGGFIDLLLKYLKFMGDMYVLGDYLNAKLLYYDEKKSNFYVKYIKINVE